MCLLGVNQGPGMPGVNLGELTRHLSLAIVDGAQEQVEEAGALLTL